MSMINIIKCNKANHICDKIQYKEAKLSDRVLLKIHLMLCSLCRDYSSKNVKLSQTIENGHIKVIRREEKEKLKDSLQKEILKTKDEC